MSRSTKGAKGPGYEYWGKRSVLGKVGREPGPDTKKRTHKAERRVSKKQIHLEE